MQVCVFSFYPGKTNDRMWNVVDTESSCFERTVPMAVGFLGRKPLLLKTLPSLQIYEGCEEFQPRNGRVVLLDAQCCQSDLK